MSLCYDFSKWTMVTLSSVAISLTFGLLLINFAHGQNMSMSQLEQQTESLKAVIDYCFQHADRPNPVQDLIDKGFLPSSFRGETCISVRQMYNDVENRISKQLANLSEERAEMEERNRRYIECARNESMTFEECNRIREGIK